jgi:hypothetical protein
MTKQVISYNIGCEPASVSAETLLQDGWSTFLLFFAVSQTASTSGQLKDIGVAVLECVGCVSTKFGYPNDEGLPEHPLYNKGVSDSSSSILEVMDSAWVKEVTAQMHQSSKRIWGGASASRSELRHFIVCLKETTFECLSSGLVVKNYAENFPTALAYVHARFSEH